MATPRARNPRGVSRFRGLARVIRLRESTVTTTAEETIAHGRAAIDDIDGRIIELVRQRMAVSTTNQEARIASGGRRVDLARENEIIARWRTELGKPGTTIAMTLLELCRGVH